MAVAMTTAVQKKQELENKLAESEELVRLLRCSREGARIETTLN